MKKIPVNRIFHWYILSSETSITGRLHTLHKTTPRHRVASNLKLVVCNTEETEQGPVGSGLIWMRVPHTSEAVKWIFKWKKGKRPMLAYKILKVNETVFEDTINSVLINADLWHVWLNNSGVLQTCRCCDNFFLNVFSEKSGIHYQTPSKIYTSPLQNC